MIHITSSTGIFQNEIKQCEGVANLEKKKDKSVSIYILFKKGISKIIISFSIICFEK